MGDRGVGFRAPATSKAAPGHKIYPYLLRGREHHRAQSCLGQRPSPIFRWRLAFCIWWRFIDWASRAVLAWRTVEHDGHRLLHRRARPKRWRGHGTPKNLQHRSGARQFTSAAFTGRLEAADIAISMDGRGRFHGQYFHRTVVALDQIRGSAPESLCRRARSAKPASDYG